MILLFLGVVNRFVKIMLICILYKYKTIKLFDQVSLFLPERVCFTHSFLWLRSIHFIMLPNLTLDIDQYSYLLLIWNMYFKTSKWQVAPGDVVELSGIFLPIPYTGFRAMRAGLIADTYLEAMSVTHFKKKYEE